MRHLIIGNGPAGVVAAETLRKRAPHDEIMLVGAEPEPPYSRMAHAVPADRQHRGDGTYLRKDADTSRGCASRSSAARATAVDTAKREVRCDTGEVLPYDRLLIATGVTPNRPPIPGIDLPNVHACWTLDDARKTWRASRSPAPRSCRWARASSAASSWRRSRRGASSSTVVEIGDRMVPRMMTAGAGAMIKTWCERKGIHVRTGDEGRVHRAHRRPTRGDVGLRRRARLRRRDLGHRRRAEHRLPRRQRHRMRAGRTGRPSHADERARASTPRATSRSRPRFPPGSA